MYFQGLLRWLDDMEDYDFMRQLIDEALEIVGDLRDAFENSRDTLVLL